MAARVEALVLSAESVPEQEAVEVSVLAAESVPEQAASVVRVVPLRLDRIRHHIFWPF